MKCSFTDCYYESNCGIAWFNSKGSIRVCDRCLKLYIAHCNAIDKLREDTVLTQEQKDFFNLSSAVLDKHRENNSK